MNNQTNYDDIILCFNWNIIIEMLNSHLNVRKTK